MDKFVNTIKYLQDVLVHAQYVGRVSFKKTLKKLAQKTPRIKKGSEEKKTFLKMVADGS